MLNDPTWGMSEVGKALAKSGDLMRERGHCKHILKDGHERVCLQGALNIAIYDNYLGGVWGSPGQLEKEKLFNACLETLAEAKGLEVENAYDALDQLINWNNADGTTGEEVIDLFKQGAEASKVIA